MFEDWTDCEEWSMFRWECKNEKEYIDTKLYAKLLEYEGRYREKLQDTPKEELEKAIENIWIMIENTKMLRFSKEAQIDRITKLVFLRHVMTIELADR